MTLTLGNYYESALGICDRCPLTAGQTPKLIAVCFQNINLFFGEYLSGAFDLKYIFSFLGQLF